MQCLVSENGEAFMLYDIKEILDKYKITSDELIDALTTGKEIKTPIGINITIDEPL